MDLSTRTLARRIAARVLVAALVFVTLLFVSIRIASAAGAEIIPSIGITKAVHGGDNAQAQIYGGLAVRAPVLPGLKVEVGAAYRSEKRDADALQVRMWPVTGSLWLQPLPILYAGGGVGWYHTTLDYAAPLESLSHTTEQFGVHLGGGLEVPLGPAALDLNGRYVFMKTQRSQLPPAEFDPDFWTTTLGLAIKF
jgi:hypothetical protein